LHKTDAKVLEDALQGALVLAKVEDWNWETIFYGHFRSIFNHCDIISLQSYRIRWKRQNKGYYAMQGHRGRYQSKARYATFYWWL